MRTKKSSLSNIEALKVMDFATAEVFYGCDQRWFATEWQCSAGCGPSVASTILLYLNRRNADRTPPPNDRKLCAARMEEVWQYVTPTDRGIPSTEMFCNAICSYGTAKGLDFSCRICDVPEDTQSRPDFAALSAFLDAALTRDIPVAFLNLCNGDEKTSTAGTGSPSSPARTPSPTSWTKARSKSSTSPDGETRPSRAAGSCGSRRGRGARVVPLAS